MKRYITVAGNIGVGKSTLVRLLCAELGCKAYFEPEAENPYLADFYRDMPAWGFHSQIFFLAGRLQIQGDIQRCPEPVIQDRSVYEDAEIFAANLAARGGISARDYATYRGLYQGVVEFLPPPDLVIYLQASAPTLMRRIAQRARDYERDIRVDYLEDLNRLYERWIDGFTLCPVLTVPADQLNYVTHPEHLALIVRKIQEKLSGKDVVVFNPDEISQI